MTAKDSSQKLYEPVNIFNRKALYDHEILEKLTAGIALKGYEVKAIREGKANFEGAYVNLLSNEAFLINMYIGAYSKNGHELSDAETRRTRKLLLNKIELEKLRRMLQQKGRTAIPLALISAHNLIKLELAVVKGRKEYSKKHIEKEKQMQKDLERDSKDLRRVTHNFD